MDKHLHNIDQLFKDGIEGYTDPPSDDVWSSIDQQLDKREVSLTKYKYRIAKYAVAAMAVLTVSFAMVLLVKSKKSAVPVLPADSAVVTPDSKPSLISRENNEPQKPATGNKNKEAAETASTEITTLEQNKPTPSVTGGAEVMTEKKAPAETLVVKDEAVAAINKTNPAEKKTSVITIEKNNPAVAQKIITKNTNGAAAVKTNAPQTKPAANRVTEQIVTQNNFNYTLAKTGAASVRLQQMSITSSASVEIKQSEGLNTLVASTAKVPVIKQKKFKPVFSVAAYFSPQYVKTDVSAGKVEQREDKPNVIAGGEKIKQAYSYGVQFTYQFSKHVAAVTGVGVSKTTSTILPRNLYARPEPRAPGQNPPPGGDMKYKINCAAGYAFIPSKSPTAPAFGDSIRALESVNTLSYVTVPVAAKYIYKKNRIAFSALAGLNMNILTKGNVKATVTEQSGSKIQTSVAVQGLKPVNLSAIVGAGAEYFATNRLSVFVMPEGNFSLTTINKNTPAQTKRGSWGMQAGLRFSF